MAKHVMIILLVALCACLEVYADDGGRYYKDVQYNGRMYYHLVKGAKGGIQFLSIDIDDPQREAIFTFNASDVRGLSIVAGLKQLLHLTGKEIFVPTRMETEERGKFASRHYFYQQYTSEGLEIDGGELAVHVDDRDHVFAISSSVLPDPLVRNVVPQGQELLADPLAVLRLIVAGGDLHVFSVEAARVADAEIGEPVLCFLYFNDAHRLVFRSLVQAWDGEKQMQFKENVYIDAVTGKMVLELPLFFPALSRAVYTANQGTSLPGTLVRREGQAAVSDVSVNQAYDNSGICYRFYYDTFKRDSFNNNGATLISTVHYSRRYNNAFWDGNQMVYGDGDGVSFSDFAGDLTVVCHELTHAVVTYSANLRYQGESGALNEGYADIMGASSYIFKEGGINKNSWNIGFQCYLAGTALRYMNNPILDGVSRDWYPTRYTGSQDNGGVHWNSGIANLAYVLAVQGGVHPQQKSTNWVQELGVSQTQQIFYNALTTLLTATSNFAAARAATELAAKRLYGDTATASISGAWIAVGVN